MSGAFRLPREPMWIAVTLKSGQWREFVVIVLFKNDRQHFTLSHNGQRFCRDISLRVFCEEFPSIAEEVAVWAEEP